MARRNINAELWKRATRDLMVAIASGRKPICAPCFRAAHPGTKPIRVLPVRAEVCHVCDRLTTMGIYVRQEIRADG